MGRTTTVSKGAEQTEVRVSKDVLVTDKTTPTRKLDFGHETGAFSDAFLEQKSWEKDIKEFLASHSCELLHHDPLVDLKLDKSQDGSGGKSQDDMPLKTLSALGGLVSSADVQQGTLLEANNGGCSNNNNNNNKTPNQCNDSILLGKPQSVMSSSGIMLEEEEEEEQVLIGRDVVYPSSQNIILPQSEGVSPLLAREVSTPLFFSTQDGHSPGNQQSFPPTTDSVPPLTLQEMMQRRNANIVSTCNSNGQTQMITEAFVNAGGNVFSGAIENKSTKNTLLAPAESNNTPLNTPLHDVKRNGMRSCKAWVDEEKRKATFANRSIPQPAERCNESEVEEDAPFFQTLSFIRLPSVQKGTSSGRSNKRPYYTVGMRVEGRCGARWFAATVAEEEKNGYVRLRWDDDGSLLHLKVKEVRLPQNNKRVDAECFKKPPCMSPVMTASQLVDIMNNETPLRPGARQARKEASNQEVDNVMIDASVLSLYVTSAAQNYSTKTQLNLDRLIKHGALVVLDSPLGLDKCQLAEEKQESQRVSFFIITEDDARENGGIIISMAHAMGISAVSVEWLGRLEIDDTKQCQRLSLPTPEELVGQGSDSLVRWRRLSKDERLLSNKRIYLKDYDTDIALLLTLCGGTVTQEAELDPVLPPHYVYAAAGMHGELPANFASVALIEKSWLFSRIYDFFHALPKPQQDIDKSAAAHKRNFVDFISGTKRRREEGEAKKRKKLEDGKEDTLRATGVMSSPLLIAGCDERERVGAGAGFDLPEVLVGEDYYFRLAQLGNNTNEAAMVKLGRVINIKDNGLVLMRLYEVKYMLMRHNPWTGSIENQTSVYLGPHTAQVSVKDLIFGIPVYVIEASQMRHVYTLESPPRDYTLNGGGGGGGGGEGNYNEGNNGS